MARVEPFRAVRPQDDLAGAVIAPPYDVLSVDEARAIAQERRSFVRVTRSEVDLPEGADAHSEEAYQQARANLDALIDQGVLLQDDEPGYLLYGQQMGEHVQVGVIAACSVAEYDRGDIAKHEFTRPDKEDDRTHHMEVLDAQVGLVLLAYRPTAAIDAIVTRATQAEPNWKVTTDDGVIHTLWRLPSDQTAALRDAFGALDRIYIADGHHRSAAASRVHANRGDEASSLFLAGLYPSDQLQVMAYNRVVLDLNGLGESGFLDAVDAAWHREPVATGIPAAPGSVHMYFLRSWHRLTPKNPATGDPVAVLDVAQLQDQLLQPILGIEDPRRSTRIRFVGGIRGPEELVRQVDDGGAAVAFHLYPTSLDQLFDVADADRVMPPKSTWFEPKLREGVAVRLLR